MNNFVARSAKVAFAQDTETATLYNRMRGFTSLSSASNPKEYTRKFVDEINDQTDVVGYAPSKEFALDEMPAVTAQKPFIDIIENEKVGDDAVVSVIVVDFSKAASPEGTFTAKQREYAVIGGSHGDNADAYTYAGTLKARGKFVTGKVVTTDDWETCTFTPDVVPAG